MSEKTPKDEFYEVCWILLKYAMVLTILLLMALVMTALVMFSLQGMMEISHTVNREDYAVPIVCGVITGMAVFIGGIVYLGVKTGALDE